jgi:alcohol dehydrogenase
MLAERTLELRLPPPPELVFAAGARAELVEIVRRYGDRAFIVTDEGVVAAGIVADVAGNLHGLDVAVHAGVEPNPTLATVQRAGAAARAFGPAVVVGLGGGSALDVAKSVALLGANPGARAVECDYRNEPERPAWPVVAVPTTAGTGSEVNGFGVIAGEHGKLYAGHASAQARVALLDPELTLSLPAAVTAASGLDVLAHALESLQARTANPYSTGLALEVVRTVRWALPRAVEDGADLEARAAMLLAAHLAARAFAATGLGTAHALAHALSDRHGVAHGVALAAVLGGVVALNRAERPAVTARAEEALGCDLATFQDRIRLTPRLAALGVSALAPLADAALHDEVLVNAPRVPTRDELLDLLRDAL